MQGIGLFVLAFFYGLYIQTDYFILVGVGKFMDAIGTDKVAVRMRLRFTILFPVTDQTCLHALSYLVRIKIFDCQGMKYPALCLFIQPNPDMGAWASTRDISFPEFRFYSHTPFSRDIIMSSNVFHE